MKVYSTLDLDTYAANPQTPKLYQPRLMHVRLDKAAHECTIDQLMFTSRNVLEPT